MSSRTNPGRKIPAATESPFTGSAPVTPLRMFVPHALGELQNSITYLQTSIIRLESAGKKNELLTAAEERGALKILDEYAELIMEWHAYISAARVVAMFPPPPAAGDHAASLKTNGANSEETGS